MRESEPKLEEREQEPEERVLVADFLRHGRSLYKENYAHEPEDDLTPQGVEQVRQTAERIVNSIDPAEEIVVLWTSPRWRAQASIRILETLLRERGIAYRPVTTLSSLRSLDQKDPVAMQHEWDKLKEEGIPAEIAYQQDVRFLIDPENIEPPTKVHRRAERVLHWLNYLNRHAETKGKRLHILTVSHSEVLQSVITDIFREQLQQGQFVQPGEDVRVALSYNTDSKQTSVSADFRGVHREGLIFNDKTRKIEEPPTTTESS